jgi:pyruvate dehydrogenase E2 component (dihydrolipoamide acetyltransferase)
VELMTELSFDLPDLGEGLADAEILRWHVAVGDTVVLNQVIAEVETAKAAVELPSPYAGQVLSLLVAEGDTVNVGTTIITFAVDTPAGATPPAQAAPAEAQTQAEERVPVLVGYGATSGTTSRRGLRRNGSGASGFVRRPVEPGPAARTTPAPPVPATPEPTPARPAPVAANPPRAVAAELTTSSMIPLAKPLVRKLARELDIDLTTVTGSGVGGVITRQDVLDHSAPAPTPEPTSRPTDQREERIPIRGVRKATAAAMVSSAYTAPHVTEFITVDVTETMDLLSRLKGSAFLDGVKLTILPFVATALIQALREHPELNSAWDDAAQEIVLKHYVNLGIATATPRGLLVPNLKDADRLGLIELARALNELTTTAREGRCRTTDLTGGTISITNVGMFGVDSGTPILNPGEAAILCLGAVRQQPWVHQGELAVRWVTTLSLSFDHRLVDGEQGSRFLAAIARTLATG